MSIPTGLLEAHPLLGSTVIVFLAELGDKTLFTLVVLASRIRAVPVLLGGWAAFVVQGLIAVTLGSFLHLLPEVAVRWGSSAIFLGCGLWLLLKRPAGEEAVHEDLAKGAWAKQFLATFGLVFVAEFGDATQLGTAALVAQWGTPVQVFIGATLGLWAGTVLAVVVGRVVGRRIPSALMRRLAGLVFCAIAVLTAWRR